MKVGVEDMAEKEMGSPEIGFIFQEICICLRADEELLSTWKMQWWV